MRGLTPRPAGTHRSPQVATTRTTRPGHPRTTPWRAGFVCRSASTRDRIRAVARTPRPVARSWQPDAALLDGLTVAAVALDADGTVVYANPTALDLFGSPFDNLVGSDARTRLFDEPERGAVDQVLKLVRRTGSWTGELAMLASGTSPVAMRTSWTPLAEGADGGALVLIEGTDESTDPVRPGPAARQPPASARRGDQRAARRRRCRGRLGHRHRPHDEGRRCDVRVAVPPGRRRDARADGTARRPGGDGQPLGDVPGGQQRPHGRERAHGSAACWLVATSVDERYPDLGGFADGTGSILCLPLVVAGGRVLGAVSLSFPGRRALSEAENLFLQLLADTCAMTLDRVEAQRAARDREAKLAFLAEASAKLSSDLDYEATLTAVAEAAVPWFADWCAISLAEDGLLRTIAVAHTHPERIALVRELQERYPADPSSDQGGYRVLRTGESQLVPEVTDELLAASARDEEHLELMRALNLSSGLVLRAQGRGPDLRCHQLGGGRGRAAVLGGRPGLRRGPGPAGRDRHRQRPAAQPGAHRRARAAARGAAGRAAARRGLVDQRAVPPGRSHRRRRRLLRRRTPRGRPARHVRGRRDGPRRRGRVGHGADAVGDPHPRRRRPRPRPPCSPAWTGSSTRSTSNSSSPWCTPSRTRRSTSCR